jgi:hypothetical protein
MSISQNRNEVLWHAATFLPQALRTATRLGPLRTAPSTLSMPPATNSSTPDEVGDHSTAARCRPDPSKNLALHLMALLPLHVGRVARVSLVRAFFRDQWLLVWDRYESPSGFAKPHHRLQPPSDCYWADPHTLERGANLHVFAEEVPFASGRGRIVVVTRRGDGHWTQPTTVLEEPHHLSYPFVFEWHGQLYMIPESLASGEVRLYRSCGSVHKWCFDRVLLPHIRAADATLLEHDGRWWMFATVSHFEWTTPTFELHILYSDSPISCEWRAHVANPVCVQAERARPAGAFIRQDGRLLRPAQDCSRGYGRAIRLMEVLELSEQTYVEREVARLLPDRAHGIRATHTVAQAGGLLIQDALTLQPRPLRPAGDRSPRTRSGR